MMILSEDLERLPGWDLIRPGLADAKAERVSPEACLVWIAAPRLRAAGLLPESKVPIIDPERTLYGLLRAQGGDAYPAYQSLLRRLSKFVRALGSV